jgi:hypothetical protein
MIRSAWDLLTHVVSTAPEWFGPMLLAWFLAVGATQAVKPWLPERMSNRERHRATQLIAIGFGLAASYNLWPASLDWRTGAAVGAVVGLWGPMSYMIFRKAIEHRWPWLRDRISGDKPETELPE